MFTMSSEEAETRQNINWRTAGNDEIVSIIREIGQAAVEKNGGYVTQADITRELARRRIKTPRDNAIELLKGVFQVDPMPPRDVGLPVNKRVYNVNRPVVAEVTVSGNPLPGIEDEFPQTPRGDFDFASDGRRLPQEGKKTPAAPHSE